MIKSYKELSQNMPYQDHYNKDNLLNIDYYDNTLILDFFDVCASICYCDFYNKRNEENYNTLEVVVPVVNIELFNKITVDINSLLSFMTNGENWNVSFIKAKDKKIKNNERQKTIFDDIKINSIALLSGGIDALSGAAQEINENNNTLFVTFETNSIERNKAEETFSLISSLNPSSRHSVILKKQFSRFSKKKHTTQRTRSLIFLASTMIYADYYDINKIKIYENGIMSLNPTFHFRRKVTKTTHPRTLWYINNILEKLGIKIRVENPFCYLTKAEVLDLIPNDWNFIISNTKTCSKMLGTKAFQNRSKSGICHCGVCTACILREISIINSSKADFDVKYIVPPNILSKNKLLELEKIKGKSFNNKTISIVNYKYEEKMSLISYYSEFKRRIDDGSIIRYLELNPNLDVETYIGTMKLLKRFSNEIDNYLRIQE